MQRLITIINCFVAADAASYLWLSVWPGNPTGSTILFLLMGLACAGLAWTGVFLIYAFSKKRASRSSVALAIAPLIVCLTYGGLKFNLPRRIAFAACRKQFEQLVPLAKGSGRDGIEIYQKIGIYEAYCVAEDEHGDVFIRTEVFRDGFFGLDHDAYGFVFCPNAYHTPAGVADRIPSSPIAPFGRTNYHQQSLGRGWYSFEITDRF